MTNIIPKSQWDTSLDDKLEAEFSGIFNFALEGLENLRANGEFTKVPQSELMLSEYRKMQDIYSAFLEDSEWCILDNDAKTQATQLYKTFSAWCRENGVNHHASKISIAREWERLGLDKKRSEKGNFYLGIGLTLRDSSLY